MSVETVLPGADEVAQEAGRQIARLLRAVPAGESFSIGLAGGSTPRRTYRVLAEEYGRSLPWLRCRFFYGDERCVPPDDLDSNHRMVRESLLDPLGIDPRCVARMHGEDPDADGAARHYELLLPEPLDLLLLGIGEDGHTASLFPGSPALRESQRRVLAVIGPKPPPRRLTVTPPVIAAARQVLVLATGSGKAEAVARALRGEESAEAVPARLARRGSWILDEAAASRLASG